MCALLREHGIDIDYADLQAQQPDAVITRAHFARFLLDHGYTKSMQEAFDRYISRQKEAFEGYGASQMKLLENAKIYEKGVYAALVIADDPDVWMDSITGLTEG